MKWKPSILTEPDSPANMTARKRLRHLAAISRYPLIARRYLITNGFDGAFTMLGMNMGFYISQGVDPAVATRACLGAAIALAVSGVSSAYISESAERKRALHELESAMIVELDQTRHGEAARYVPVLIALVNGLVPLAISLLIISPLWLASRHWIDIPHPVTAAILIAFTALFGLGVYAGIVANSPWWWTGLRTLLIGVSISLAVVLLA